MYRQFALSTVLALVACGGGTAPRAFTAHEHILGGQPASAFPEAVLVDLYDGAEKTGACAGTMVAPKVVLTAGHCVNAADYDSWTVTAPFADNQASSSHSAVTFDWSQPKGSHSVDGTQHDIGLILLDDAITLDEYPRLSVTKLPAGDTLSNIGRKNDGTISSDELYLGEPVAIGEDPGYPFDYTGSDIIEPGDSGGACIDLGQPVHVVVAVNSGAGNAREMLARVDVVYDWIQSIVALHGGGSAGTASATPANGDGDDTSNGPPPPTTEPVIDL